MTTMRNLLLSLIDSEKEVDAYLSMCEYVDLVTCDSYLSDKESNEVIKEFMDGYHYYNDKGLVMELIDSFLEDMYSD